MILEPEVQWQFRIPAKAKYTYTHYFSHHVSFVGWPLSVLCCLHPRAQAERVGPFWKSLCFVADEDTW